MEEVDNELKENEENIGNNTLPESVTKPAEGCLTTSDTLLWLVLGIDNSANRLGQNISESQDDITGCLLIDRPPEDSTPEVDCK